MEIRIAAGPHARDNCPVRLPVTGKEGGLWLVERGSGLKLPVQRVGEGDSEGCAILTKLASGKTAEYTLESGDPAGERVACRDDGAGRVEVSLDGNPVLTYHYGDVPKPFVYPVYGPGGENLTRGFPMVEIDGETRDHPHHRGLWTAHGDRDGIDNWKEGDDAGTIAHRKLSVRSGPVFGEIRAGNVWLTASGHERLDETRTITVYGVDGSARLLDYTVELKAAHGDYLFEDTKEGGIISWRMATWMDEKNGGHIVNAYGGRTEKETWAKRAPWCDYWAEKDGRRLGVAIYDHPGNFRHPTYWHIRGYGLFTANPFGLSHFVPGRQGAYVLHKGESMTFRYRVLMHEGATEEAGVAERYHDFVNAPAVNA